MVQITLVWEDPCDWQTMRPLDTIILSLYLVLICALALYFSRRQQSAEDYFLAGRKLPGWVVGFSVMGTIVSSTSFVGHPGNVFNSNFWAITLHLTLPLVVILAVGRLVVFYRNTLAMSPYEYLGIRFGYPAQVYGSLTYILNRILDMSLTFYFMALALAFVTGWDVWWVVLGVGILTLVYTLMGGIQAVVWTDMLQGILLVGGGFLCVIIIVAKGGVSEMINMAWQGGKFSLGNWQPSLTEKNFWLLLVAGTLNAFQGCATNQNMVQRYLLARSDHEAKRGVTLGILSCLPVWLLFMFLGALLWSFYQTGPAGLPIEVQQVKDNIMPHFILTQLPQGLLGLLLAGLLAAAMSSLDSDLNSVAAVTLQNFYRYFQPEGSQERQLFVGRAGVFGAGFLAILLAQKWIGIESLIEYAVGLELLFLGGILGLFTLGWISPKSTSTGAYLGIGSCVLFTLWAALTGVQLPSSQRPMLDLGTYNFPWLPLTIGIVGQFIVIGVGYVSSRLLRTCQGN